MDPADLAIITNRDLIAINQAGVPASPLDIQQLRNKPQQAWFTKNRDGSFTLALFNLGPDTSPIKFSWRELDALRDTNFAQHPPALTDLVTHQTVPTPPEDIDFTLDSHSSRVFRLIPPR